MAAFGIKAIQPQDNEHILGFATARATADMALLEIWNGPTNADLKYTLDKDGQHQSADGTALRPTYAFENDKTSGLYYIASNNIGFAVNAVLMLEYATFGLGIQNAYGLVVGHTGQLVTGDPSSPGTAITAELQVAGTATADSTMMLTRHSADANAGGITMSKSRNAALGSYTVVQDNDYLGHLAFAADDGTDSDTTVARISGRVDDSSPAASDIGGELVLETASGTGANNLSAALTLAADKLATFVGIISVTDATEATSTTAASLKTAGGIAWVKDAYVGDDMFFTSGAILDFDSADMTITHSANALTVAGGTFATEALTASTGVFSGILKTNDTTDATSGTDGSLQTDGGLSVVLSAWIGANVTADAYLASADDSGALGESGTAFADLFLASGSVINFSAADMTITHAANTLAVAGGTWTHSGSFSGAFVASFTNTNSAGHGMLIQGGGTSGTRYILNLKDAGGTDRYFFHDDGTATADVAWNTFDRFNDLQVLDDLTSLLAQPGEVVNRLFGKVIKHDRSFFERENLFHDIRDVGNGRMRGMMNYTKMIMLNSGTIRQVGGQVIEVRTRQEQLEECVRHLVEANPRFKGRDEALALLAA